MAWFAAIFATRPAQTMAAVVTACRAILYARCPAIEALWATDAAIANAAVDETYAIARCVLDTCLRFVLAITSAVCEDSFACFNRLRADL